MHIGIRYHPNSHVGLGIIELYDEEDMGQIMSYPVGDATGDRLKKLTTHLFDDLRNQLDVAHYKWVAEGMPEYSGPDDTRRHHELGGINHDTAPNHEDPLHDDEDTPRPTYEEAMRAIHDEHVSRGDRFNEDEPMDVEEEEAMHQEAADREMELAAAGYDLVHRLLTLVARDLSAKDVVTMTAYLAQLSNQ